MGIVPVIGFDPGHSLKIRLIDREYGRQLHPVGAFARTDPYRAIGCFGEAADVLAGQFTEVVKAAGLRIEHIGAIVHRTDPDAAQMVFEQGLDLIAGHGKRIERIIMVHPEIIAVVAIQSVFGGKPEKAFFILQQVIDHPLRQAIGGGQAFEIGGLCR